MKNTELEIENIRKELESLEKSNSELDDKIELAKKNLEKKCSIGSITENDLQCLSQIRKLVEDEVRMKRTISELENTEAVLRGQVEKILGCGKSNKHHAYRTKMKKNQSSYVSKLRKLPENKNNMRG